MCDGCRWPPSSCPGDTLWPLCRTPATSSPGGYRALPCASPVWRHPGSVGTWHHGVPVNRGRRCLPIRITIFDKGHTDSKRSKVQYLAQRQLSRALKGFSTSPPIRLGLFFGPQMGLWRVLPISLVDGFANYRVLLLRHSTLTGAEVLPLGGVFRPRVCGNRQGFSRSYIICTPKLLSHGSICIHHNLCFNWSVYQFMGEVKIHLCLLAWKSCRIVGKTSPGNCSAVAEEAAAMAASVRKKCHTDGECARNTLVSQRNHCQGAHGGLCTAETLQHYRVVDCSPQKNSNK